MASRERSAATALIDRSSGLEHRSLEVHRDSFADEDRGASAVEAGGGERDFDVVGREVGRDVGDRLGVDAQPVEALTLVLLRRRDGRPRTTALLASRSGALDRRNPPR